MSCLVAIPSLSLALGQSKTSGLKSGFDICFAASADSLSGTGMIGSVGA